MIPETIKCRGYRRCNRSEGEDVEVEKLRVRGELKILVGDVASADDRRLIVDGKGLVVHAPVRRLEVQQEVQHRAAAARDGIEEANLDVRVLIEPQQVLVLDRREHVVEQEANPNTAIRRLDELAGEDQSGAVVLDQEILCIDAALGLVDQRKTCTERVQSRG